jgi:hypothetical protein
VIGLDIAVKLPSIVGNLDVNRWQARIVPFRFAARTHMHLSGRIDFCLLSVLSSSRQNHAASPGPISDRPGAGRDGAGAREPGQFPPRTICAIDLHLCPLRRANHLGTP